MTVLNEGGFVLKCDDCGFEEPPSPGAREMVVLANKHAWKVLNHPTRGIVHLCMNCSGKPANELSMRMRESLSFHESERGAGDSTGCLDDIVVSSAEALLATDWSRYVFGINLVGGDK